LFLVLIFVFAFNITAMRSLIFVVLSLLVVVVVGAAPKVKIIAFEMSKCPDTSVWKGDFDTQVMQAPGLPDILEIDEEFVASSTTNCMHGPGECVGNKILLCARNLTIENNTVRWGWWNMGVCMQANGAYENVPDNAPECAKKAGLDWNAINSCASSAQGSMLFSDSINFCNLNSIRSTPTIYINGKSYPDGPTNNLQAVCQAYTGSPKPKGCGDY